MEYTHIRIDKETKKKLEAKAGGKSLIAYLRQIANNNGTRGELTLHDLAVQIGEARAAIIRAVKGE